jgi:hypothetical protein
MKKICPLCETENDKDAMFCKECNEPLYDPGIYNNLENPYASSAKKKEQDSFIPTESKIPLDKESFSNLLLEWVLINIQNRKSSGYYQMVLDNLNQYQSKKIPSEKFELEIYYLHMWLAYHNSILYLQNNNRVNDYFSPFISKMRVLISKVPTGRSDFKKDDWENLLSEKINEYGRAFHSYFIEETRDPSFLGLIFLKNLYGEWKYDCIESFTSTNFVLREIKDSFKTLGKELTKYEI